jgi:hypothetical protein
VYGDPIQLHVWFELEAKPPWERRDEVAHDFAAEILATPIELKEAAADLRRQRERFPDRVPAR